MLMCLNTLLTLCAYQSEFWHGRLLSTSLRPPNNRSFGDHLHFFRTTNKHFGLSHEFTQLAGPASPERHPLPTSALAAAARPVTGLVAHLNPITNPITQGAPHTLAQRDGCAAPPYLCVGSGRGLISEAGHGVQRRSEASEWRYVIREPNPLDYSETAGRNPLYPSWF